MVVRPGSGNQWDWKTKPNPRFCAKRVFITNIRVHRFFPDYISMPSPLIWFRVGAAKADESMHGKKGDRLSCLRLVDNTEKI